MDERLARIAAHVRAHILFWLTLALVPSTAVTVALTRAFRQEQQSLAAEWQQRGERALAAGDADLAIEAFRSALAFSREDRAVALRLATALATSGRDAEARAYLFTLRDEQPGNGEINLALARLEAKRHDVAAALRYYHQAIEGAWREQGEEQRRTARLELAAFLLRERAVAQSQVELMALAGDLPPGRDDRLRVAALMRDAGMHQQARLVYDALLADRRTDVAALEGAGEAAFATGDHAGAVAYLGRASRAGKLSADAAARLETARLVLTTDPLQPRLPGAERRGRARRALVSALARLDGCAAAQAGSASLQALSAEAASLRGRVSDRSLARDPDLMDVLLSLVWRIELQTAELCGQPAGVDAALLLLARQRQDAQR